MLSYLVLAVYMMLFILAKWNVYIVITQSTLYGNASHEQEKHTLHDQERKHLLE